MTGALMDDPTRSLRMDHRHGEAWERYGNIEAEPGYTVRIDPPRASFDTRNLRWLVYGPAIAAVVAWWVLW
jgi:hypothetical protein